MPSPHPVRDLCRGDRQRRAWWSRGRCLVPHHRRKLGQSASAQGAPDRREIARAAEALSDGERRIEIDDGVPPAGGEGDHLARPLEQLHLAEAAPS